jgi:hypothetical protein
LTIISTLMPTLFPALATPETAPSALSNGRREKVPTSSLGAKVRNCWTIEAAPQTIEFTNIILTVPNWRGRRHKSQTGQSAHRKILESAGNRTQVPELKN